MYRQIDHTADLGMEVAAADISALFGEAGYAWRDLTCDSTRIISRDIRQVQLQRDDVESLLVAWLNTLIVLFEVDGWLPGCIEIEVEAGAASLRATLRGEAYDASRHTLLRIFKAATYHGLQVMEQADGWTARIIFDL